MMNDACIVICLFLFFGIVIFIAENLEVDESDEGLLKSYKKRRYAEYLKLKKEFGDG